MQCVSPYRVIKLDFVKCKIMPKNKKILNKIIKNEIILKHFITFKKEKYNFEQNCVAQFKN